MAQNLKNIKANSLFSSVPSMTVTGNSTIDNVNLTGNIIPDIANVYGLGNVTHYFKDAFIGPGSLYVNGKKVLEDVSGTINFTTDINQNLKITTSGSGDVIFDPIGTGVISIKGPLQIEAGVNLTSSDGNAINFANPIGVNSITTHQANTDLAISANGTGTIKLNDDVTVSGNLTVSGTTTYINTETVQLYDNIIDLNSNFTTGSPTENAGVRVLRGDDPAVLVRWNESTDKWQYTVDGTAYVDIVGTTSIGATALGNAATANFFIGSGNNLSNIQGANVSGFVANANIANIAHSVAVANVSGIGNIATINRDGNAGNILYGNGVFAAHAAGSYGDGNVVTLLTSFGSNTISTTGNVSVGNLNATTVVVASRLTSNVATGTAPLTVTSTTRVSNLNVAYANVTDYVGTGTAQNGNFNITLQSGTSGNIQPLGNSAFIANASSGTLFSTLFTGTLTTNAQPNITSIGTLTTLTSGTHTISANANITMSGSLSQVSGANLVSATYISGDGSLLTNLKANSFMTVALSDEATAITTGVGKVTFRAPFAMTLYQIPRASLSTASTSGNPAVNIKKNSTTIFSTTLTIDANEKTSVTAATPAVLSTTTFADDDEITMDIDAAGTGAKGLKVTLYYRRT
jgi:hypothetical protein